MARSRNIKPGFFLNDTLAELDPFTRLLFIGLWTIADKEGRLDDRPKRIHAACLPYDQVNVDSCLSQLCAKGFIIRYQVPEGGQFIQIVNWRKHQQPHHKEIESIIPEYQQDIHACANVEPSKAVLVPLIPDSLNLIPDSGFPPTDSGLPDSQKSSPRKSASPKKINGVETKAAWDAYEQAYRVRYGVDPVRNAKVNSQMKQVVERLGAEDGPQVAGWYVSHNNLWYVQKGHSVDQLLKDAEKLRTEWVTGKIVTATRARQIDVTQTNASVFHELLEEARNAGK